MARVLGPIPSSSRAVLVSISSLCAIVFSPGCCLSGETAAVLVLSRKQIRLILAERVQAAGEVRRAAVAQLRQRRAPCIPTLPATWLVVFFCGPANGGVRPVCGADQR